MAAAATRRERTRTMRAVRTAEGGKPGSRSIHTAPTVTTSAVMATTALARDDRRAQALPDLFQVLLEPFACGQDVTPRRTCKCELATSGSINASVTAISKSHGQIDFSAALAPEDTTAGVAACVASGAAFCMRFHWPTLSSDNRESSDSRGSAFTAIQSLWPPPRTS